MKRYLFYLSWLVLIYFVLAYAVLPFFWRHYEHHPALESAPKTTQTAEGFPGDPLNVGLVGTKEEVVHAMITAGWSPADPKKLATDVHIVESVLLNRPYPEAPVSNLYLWNRPQDVAFEKDVSKSPKVRHHVRFWQSKKLQKEGRLFWIGAATFDRSIGICRRTGQITHHIEADVDMERDMLMEDLIRAGQIKELYQVTGVGPTIMAKNGGGDRYFTDGELTVGVLAEKNQPQLERPRKLSNPSRIHFKNRVWRWGKKIVGKFYKK